LDEVQHHLLIGIITEQGRRVLDLSIINELIK
jgi:hypothetical protein